MITTAVANLQESILQAEAEVSSLAKQQREKRAELRRYHKALKALTGDVSKRTRRPKTSANNAADTSASSGSGE